MVLTDSSRAIPAAPHLVQRDDSASRHHPEAVLSAGTLKHAGELAGQLLVPSLFVACHVERDGHVRHLQSELRQRGSDKRRGVRFCLARRSIGFGHGRQPLVQVPRDAHHLARFDHEGVEILQRIVHIELR